MLAKERANGSGNSRLFLAKGRNMSAHSDGKTPGTSPAHIPLIPQKHGGALLSRGVPGNRGGRPTSAVRAAAALAVDQRIPVLEAIADDPEGRPADRVRAVDLLGRLGGVAKDEPIPNELVRLLAMDVGAVARSADFGGTDDAEGFLSHVYDRWAVTLGAFRAGDT